jgi:hypothetical protein
MIARNRLAEDAGQPAGGVEEDAPARGDRSLECRVACGRHQDDDGAAVVCGETSGEMHRAV